MRFSCALFLISISMELAVSATMKTMVFPTETNTDYVELTPLKPLDLQAFTLCMRVATELVGQRKFILFSYRTTDDDELNLWHEPKSSLALYLRSISDGVSFQVPELGALETHLCVTWDSSSGATTVFVDGKKSQTKIYRKGHGVHSGGKLILGQDQDEYGGSFEIKQSFVGEISDVNMWDSVIPEHTIKSMFSGETVQTGNVLDWKTIILGINGEAKVLDRKL